MAGQELASRVTSTERYEWEKNSIELAVSPWREDLGEAPGSPRQHILERGGVRFRHQAKYSEIAGGSSLRCDRGSGANFRGRCIGIKPDGVFLSNGPGDPEPVGYAIENIRKLIGTRPGVRNLPRPSAVRPCAWRKNLQIEIWPSRIESSGKEFADGPSGNHRAESRLRGGSGIAAVERRGNYSREFE